MRDHPPPGDLDAAAGTDATANSATLAFPWSGAYSREALGGRANVYFHTQFRSRICLGDALSGRAGGPRPNRACGLLDSGLADGIRGDPATDQSPNAYGNFPSFDFRDVGNGSSYARYNFSNGFFVGSQRNTMGFSGLSQSAFGGFGSLYSEGVQFGYSLKNGGGPPVTFFAGFDTLKYNSGIGSNAFAPFDSKSGTLPVSSAYAGVEFQPTSNLSLSLGVGVVQQTGADRQRDQFAARRLVVLGGRPPLLGRGLAI